MMTTDLPEQPRYFSMDVEINRGGATPLGERPMPPALSPEDVGRLSAAGAIVLDVRAAAAFGTGHVPGSINVGLAGQFASWAGTLLDPHRRLVIVADDEAGAHEAVVRLARVGLETIGGHLAGGVAAWDRAGLSLGRVLQMPVDELRAQIHEKREGLQVVDVRRPGEYASGHVPGAISVPLDRLEEGVATVEASQPTAVICAGGYRSSAATSLLRRHGFADLYNVVGGTSAWIAAGYEVEGPGPSGARTVQRL